MPRVGHGKGLGTLKRHIAAKTPYEALSAVFLGGQVYQFCG